MKSVPVVVVLLALAAAAGSTALAGSRLATDEATSLADLRGVNFVSPCRFSHRAPDDPIVSPRVPGASHDHSFVGNRSTSASSTLASLEKAAGTTCHRPADTAAYWMPTLIANGRAVAPVAAQIYYRRRTLAEARAFPPGFKMIAGNAHAGAPQGRQVTFWNCGVEAGVPPSETVPTCPDARRASLRLHVHFPDCWNGASLDSGDHRRHVAYSMRGRCPATHPVAVPRITLIYRYPIAGGAGVELSSGGQFSAHADFFNAWQQSALERLVRECLNALRHCARGS